MGNDDRRHQYREYGRRKLQKNMKRWKWRIQKMLVWMILELAISLAFRKSTIVEPPCDLTVPVCPTTIIMEGAVR
jgi:hypothetical protein